MHLKFLDQLYYKFELFEEWCKAEANWKAANNIFDHTQQEQLDSSILMHKICYQMQLLQIIYLLSKASKIRKGFPAIYYIFSFEIYNKMVQNSLNSIFGEQRLGEKVRVNCIER